MERTSVLIVSCHPAPASQCARIVGLISHLLAERGVQFTIDDLYRSQFDPVLSESEIGAYFAGTVPPDISDLVAHLRDATELVFVFPLWMFNMPAMLKGYFEKIFRPQVAFRFSGGNILPLLTQIRRLTVVVTHGRNETETAQSGDASRVFFEMSLPALLPGLVSNERFDLYGLDAPDQEETEDMLAALRLRFRG
jgi:putative NADPH-quinone reductase